MRIHQAIQRHEYPNCHQLARAMEVAIQTIKRDLEFMRVRLKLPIAYDPLRWGFYYTRPVEEFPTCLRCSSRERPVNSMPARRFNGSWRVRMPS